MRYQTLCGCLSFGEAEYQFGFPAIKVRMHYKMNPACKAKARASWIWQQRESIGNKSSVLEEHDIGYDVEI